MVEPFRALTVVSAGSLSNVAPAPMFHDGFLVVGLSDVPSLPTYVMWKVIPVTPKNRGLQRPSGLFELRSPPSLRNLARCTTLRGYYFCFRSEINCSLVSS